jgi:hypothetical protein
VPQPRQQLKVPDEIATVRLLLSQACRNCADEDSATRSLLRAATFDLPDAPVGHR